MNNFYTSVVEFRQTFSSVVETHPYECGWADEAIFFVELHEPAEGTCVGLRVQLSPDGIRWMDEGTAFEVTDTAFAGMSNEYHIEVPGLGDFAVFAQNRGAAILQPGDAVTLSWHPEHAFGLDGADDVDAGEDA